MIVTLGVLVILLTFLGLYGGSQGNSQYADAVVARVNGHTVRRAMLQASYERLKQQQQVQLGSDFRMSPTLALQLRQQALDQLILTEVLSQRARRQGYVIEEVDIVSSLRQIPLFQVDGGFSLPRFQEVIAAAGHTESSFLIDLKKSMLINQVRIGLLQSAFALPGEVDFMIRLLHQQRDFKYLIVSVDHFRSANSLVSAQKALQYYQQNRDQFHTPEQVSIDYLLLSLADIKARLRRTHPKWTATRVQQQAEKQFLEASHTLAHLAYTNAQSLTEAARALDLPVQSTPLFSQTGGTSIVTRHREVILAAFSQDVLQGHNSGVVKLDNTQRLVLRVKQHQAAGFLAFEAVKAKIQSQLNTQLASQKAHKWGEHLVQKLKKTPAAVHAVGQLPFNWHSVKQTNRYGIQAPSAIVSAVFRMPRPQKNEMTVTGFSLPNGHYAVLCLLAVRDGKTRPIKLTQRAIYQEELATELGQFDYALYTRLALHHAKITNRLEAA